LITLKPLKRQRFTFVTVLEAVFANTKQKSPVVDAFVASPPYHQTGSQAKILNMSALAEEDAIVVPEQMKKVIAIAKSL
jgi:hypothetical protein